MKRGRKPNLDSEKFFHALEENRFELFENKKLKSNIDPIWTKICEQLDNKITSISLYLSVFQNRHDYQLKLKSVLGIAEINYVENESYCDYEENDERKDN